MMKPFKKSLIAACAFLFLTALATQTVVAQEDRDPFGPGANPGLNAADRAQHANQQELARREQIIEQLQRELEEVHKRMQTVHEEFQQRLREQLPPLENGILKVFQPHSIDPESVAAVLHELLGPAQIRLAPDSEHGRLLVYAPAKVLAEVESLLQTLDVPGKSAEGASMEDDFGESQSLMVRIFWLADGLPIGEGNEAEFYLPQPVLDAVDDLGLTNIRLVSQSTASLAIGEAERESEFHFNFPAVVHGKTLRFQSHGEMRLDEQPRLNLFVEISGQFEIGGQLTAPLGHYMVLGTANYVDRKTSPEAKLSTSRFAFVVQVIEAESFAPE